MRLTGLSSSRLHLMGHDLTGLNFWGLRLGDGQTESTQRGHADLASIDGLHSVDFSSKVKNDVDLQFVEIN